MCQYKYIPVHTSTYWYILAHTLIPCFVSCTQAGPLESCRFAADKTHTSASSKFIMIYRPISLQVPSWQGARPPHRQPGFTPEPGSGQGAGPLSQLLDPQLWGHEPLPCTDVVAAK